ncbi:MAG TPA: hypothetical protein VLN49_10365 [Gemmatimonadaceae bacterium]|nr:hypothetical protein [Gemmatimonadaceae bacterium]
MFKRFAALVAIAAVIAACSSESTAPRTIASGAAAFSSGVSSPNTAVGSQFVVYVEGATFYAGDGRPSRNGMGQCRSHSDGTTGWYWVPGNVQAGGRGSNGAASGDQENGPNHAQCRFVSGGYTVTVTFSDVANYVKAGNGNMALNFNSFCVPNADPALPPVCYPRDVHYQKNSNFTQGQGVLHGTGVRSDNNAISHWSIDLSQVSSSSNLIDDPPRQLLVMAHNDEGWYADSPATISW